MKKQEEQLTFGLEKNALEEAVFVLYEIVILKSFEAETGVNFASLKPNEQKRLLIACTRDNIPEPRIAEPVVSLIEKLHTPQHFFY
ncbi:hypothetical protein [Alteromonas macleodii]|uniref:hypothetical protein n=1 Tax=Alteromonas macleodii TaxID=28108 RepID=UPI00066DE432|nr:hypothetical protein [Alteromonas macleodii]CAI3966875.1 hypothetical protein MIT1002_03405 [Alteromonas macleodii]VTP55315.1 hypothetical protein MIT1002_03405 [Alteromonas macleodii]